MKHELKRERAGKAEMDACAPKNEREWWAFAEIGRLRAEVESWQESAIAYQQSSAKFATDADRLRAEVERLRAELERERMRLAACGVVALANTPKSAAAVRTMHADYHSGSLDSVIGAVDREMRMRAALEILAVRAHTRELGLIAERALRGEQP